MPELSGEQKLRIVLESIIRKVPIKEQCQKYGIQEGDFTAWQEHFTQNGGKIFEPDFGRLQTSSGITTNKKTGTLTKVGLTFSLLVNIALLCIGGVYFFKEIEKPVVAQALPDQVSPLDSPLHFAQPKNDFPKISEASTVGKASKEIDELILSAQEDGLQKGKTDLESLLANPLELPVPQIIPPADIYSDINSEVTFMGKSYEGRHVVYILDVGDYVLQGDGAVERFEKMKNAVLSSMVTLSPNSYFNLILYWNLREASALGKTILKANRENVKFAIDWITGLGNSLEDLRENRNQFVPKELLYLKPLPGVVGPWFALGLGITFDPDLIFILSGNSVAFPMSAVPKSHFNGLDLNQRSLLNGSAQTEPSQSTSPLTSLIKQTARKWLVSLEPPGSLPDNVLEIEKIALRRLGLTEEFASAKTAVSIPWEKVFQNFLSSLEVNAQMIPQTNFFLCMPPHIRWPNDLFNTASEFAESSKGGLVENPDFP